MNKFTYSILILVLVSLGTGPKASAQQKIGYVDTDFLLSKIPEYQGIQQQLDLIAKEWREELEEMQKEIDRLKEDFSAKEILYTEELRKQKEEEIRKKIQELENYLDSKFGPEGEYYKKQEELLEPIQRKVFEAITNVAQREGFDFVFDRSEKANMLFVRKEWDLNSEVLLELGISIDELSN